MNDRRRADGIADAMRIARNVFGDVLSAERLDEIEAGIAVELALDVALQRRCRVCGCTDGHACQGGCYWIGPTLCSRCGPKPSRPSHGDG